jgi:hypothetical protein
MADIDDKSLDVSIHDNVDFSRSLEIDSQRRASLALKDGSGNKVDSFPLESDGIRSLPVSIRSQRVLSDYCVAFQSTTHFTVNTGTNQDLIVLRGSAAKVIRINRVLIMGNGSTSQQGTISLIKRSTDDTGGTSTALTIVPLDSSNPASTAAARFYTAAPTQGTLVGAVASHRNLFNTAGSGTLVPQPAIFDFSGHSFQRPVLRAVTEIFAINLSNTSGNFVPTLSGFIWFTEE